MADQQDMIKQVLSKAIATAWIDASFKARLLSNPRSILAEMGLMPPAHIEILAVENTPARTYLTLPAPWANTSDPAFMQRLQQNPRPTLSEVGINIPDSTEILFLENTSNKNYLVLPVTPGNNEISIEKI